MKKRSYVDNAKYHRESKASWSLDIADFFPSCSDNNVAWFFSRVLQCEPDITRLFVRLVTLNGSLPQGSPCSPILAYFSNMNMWEDINAMAKKYNCKLTIYADDITISGDIVPKKMIYEIKKRIERQALQLNDKKEQNTICTPFEVTGVIVKGRKTLIPNRKHQMLGKLNREYARTKNPAHKKSLSNKINGRLAQQKQVEGEN